MWFKTSFFTWLLLTSVIFQLVRTGIVLYIFGFPQMLKFLIRWYKSRRVWTCTIFQIMMLIRYLQCIGNWLIYKLISNLNGLLPINSRKIALTWSKVRNLVFNGLLFTIQQYKLSINEGEQIYCNCYMQNSMLEHISISRIIQFSLDNNTVAQ